MVMITQDLWPLVLAGAVIFIAIMILRGRRK